jgi:hypothetical protein
VTFDNFHVRGGIRGWKTTMVIAPLTAPSGDGIVTDEFWLAANGGCYCWIETGHDAGTDPWYADSYYWAARDPSGLLLAHVFGPVLPADIGHDAELSVYETGPSAFNITVSTPSASYTATSTNSFLTDPTAFGEVKMGQELAGTYGAVAGYTSFYGNEEYSGGTWADETSTPSVLIDSPPYGVWTSASQWPPGGLFWTECCINPSASAAPPQPSPRHPVSFPPVRPPTGLAAVRVSRPGQVPGFTAAEAQAYAIAHTPGTTVVRGRQVARTTFLTAAQLTVALRGAATGLPADTPVCYVVLNGRFSFVGPPLPGHKQAVLHFPYALDVFDARTGNVLMSGYQPSLN